jgi:hypothetical protein
MTANEVAELVTNAIYYLEVAQAGLNTGCNVQSQREGGRFMIGEVIRMLRSLTPGDLDNAVEKEVF